MKIVFGVMSAVHSAATIEQLARALAPWPVVIHHDFKQTPDFAVNAPNVSFVSEPKRTGWAVWGFSEGILHLLDQCLNEFDADYFQLLSPTCLPVRPLSEFEAHVAANRFDVHTATVQIESDPDLFMNFGYRAYCAQDSAAYRLLRKLRSCYFGRNALRFDLANLQTQKRASSAPPGLAQKFAWLVTDLARRGWFTSHPFVGNELIATAGGTWFGCRRDAGQYLINKARTPSIENFFSRMHIPDEMMFATLFSCSPFDVGEANHYVHEFDEANPRWLEAEDLATVAQSGRFFARKFRDDPADSARIQNLKAIGCLPAADPQVNSSESGQSSHGAVLSKSLY